MTRYQTSITLVAKGIAHGLLRDGVQSHCGLIVTFLQHEDVERWAEERARNIVMALMGQFELIEI